MRFTLCLCFILSLLYACKEPPKELPLEEEQLVEVLADIHIAEAAGQQLRGLTKDSVMQAYYAQVCSIHQVDEGDLKRSMEQLRNEPEKLQRMYEKVTEAIERADTKAQ